MFHKLKNLTRPNIRGFSLVEYMVATVLIAIMFGGIGKVMVATIKSGRFSQKLTDINLLSLKKSTALYNDSVNQANFIPKNQTQIGSIDPSNPVTGYFDLLNESGCLLGSFTKNPNDDGGKGGNDDNPKGKTAKNDPVNNIGQNDKQNYGGGATTLDCSTSNVLNPSNSLIPKFRRQWLVRKDFPNPKDVTISVIVVYQDTNAIARTRVVTKSDGTTKQ